MHQFYLKLTTRRQILQYSCLKAGFQMIATIGARKVQRSLRQRLAELDFSSTSTIDRAGDR